MEVHFTDFLNINGFSVTEDENTNFTIFHNSNEGIDKLLLMEIIEIFGNYSIVKEEEYYYKENVEIKHRIDLFTNLPYTIYKNFY